MKVPCTAKIVSIKKGAPSSIGIGGFSGPALPASSFVKPNIVASSKNVYPQRSDATLPKIAAPAPSSMDISPADSDGLSVSMDESMSTCDSLKSPDVEYLDSNEIAAVDSIEKKTSTKLCISDHAETPGLIS